uniref:Glycoprotein vOX2-2 n=2 Tax=Elephantid herpesvirus 1 TaxID=146015 RepID=A0A386AUC4_ELHV1|nr:glycoprotein vOX2-2 [Elephant endotheliotropic herpesvirus 1B]AYC62753.1 glycoprotein vOX2-2 [Elephant endotheliotropic herpesvirus 1A]
MFLGPYVETKNHQLALLNTNVTLNCDLKNSYDSIFIIAWHKNGTNGRTNVGTTGKQFHEKEVQVTTVTHDDNMKSSGLNILNTTKNDSCCFICSFHCSNKGPSNCSVFSNTTCLTIYAPLTAYIAKSNDSSNITCTATSYPPPTVTWIGATTTMNDTRITLNNNGTVSVESTLATQLEDINVTCEVKHLENTTRISWWSDHHKGHVSVSLIEVLFLSNSASVVSVGILIVLIVMVIILVYYKFIRKPGDLIRLYS